MFVLNVFRCFLKAPAHISLLSLVSLDWQAVFAGKSKDQPPQQLDKYTRKLLEAATPPKHSQKSTAAADAEVYEGGACSKCGQPGHNKLNCPHNQLRGGS